MSLLLKDPSAVLDYAIDWGRQYLNGDALAASEWSSDPDDLTIVASSFGPQDSQVTLGGGEAGRVYRVTNHVSTQAGRQDKRSLIIRVEAR